jgi:hypothetical protein
VDDNGVAEAGGAVPVVANERLQRRRRPDETNAMRTRNREAATMDEQIPRPGNVAFLLSAAPHWRTTCALSPF